MNTTYKVTTIDGHEVKKGDRIESYRGETWEFQYCVHPRKITVSEVGESSAYSFREFYPSVFNLVIEEVA